MEYKKSYWGLCCWLIAFLAVCFAVLLLPVPGMAMMRITINLCSVGMAILAWMVYINGYVYWYNGVSFEEARDAGEERRKQYAFKHVRVFGIFAVCGLLFSALMQLLHISEWVDFVVLTIGLIAAAISTIRFKL
ncbi:MAG: hypothetical protein IJP04_01475 [Clostridia bacterium]|nr:hypothetical protein [Clostridia bacterium]